VLIEPCTMPLRMTRMQFIDATRDYDAALRRCLAEIGAGDRGPAIMRRITDPLSPDILEEAEQRLTGLIGPIAPVLVRQAAARSASRSELYALLAKSLASDDDRKRFLAGSGEAPPAERAAIRAPPQPVEGPTQGPDEELTEVVIQSVTLALTYHLGPIASALVRRERALAASREDLCQRLAQRIPDERDRARFLKAIDGS
jgi:hypothetical protein